LLEVENQKVNLVSRETSRADLERLAAESLLPFEVIKAACCQSYLDIGSGGGLPAFPIIMCLGVENSILVERTKKKASALTRMAAKSNLKITVHDTNFEETKFDRTFDLVTLRLVKLTESLLKKIVGLLSNGGILVYYSNFEKNTGSLKVHKTTCLYNVGPESNPKFFTIFTKET
jgi:16S rRNA G527 N7-methylase RsmG